MADRAIGGTLGAQGGDLRAELSIGDGVEELVGAQVSELVEQVR